MFNLIQIEHKKARAGMLVLPVNVEIIALGSLLFQINSFEALLILMYQIKIIQYRQCHDVLETVVSVIKEKK